MTTAATITSHALTAHDRCDRCGAAAKVRASLPTGGELLFCGHHAREHSAALRAIGAGLSLSPPGP
ncbi:DUF7455 domain-containing protein [Pseudonocardia nigra]|uniref:DUF7455 domain-containing protein n=1 Tax=Pseudonocardia nigra TaxID=1921578 RepID=UPI001C5D6D1C|nr:hypothetical protein [Pseudonocardia nigra]